MYEIGVSKESLDKIMPSESVKWTNPIAVQWTGNNLKEIQKLIGRDRATMLVPKRLVIHTDAGPAYPAIGDWIVKSEGIIGIDLAHGPDMTGGKE